MSHDAGSYRLRSGPLEISLIRGLRRVFLHPHLTFWSSEHMFSYSFFTPLGLKPQTLFQNEEPHPWKSPIGSVQWPKWSYTISRNIQCLGGLIPGVEMESKNGLLAHPVGQRNSSLHSGVPFITPTSGSSKPTKPSLSLS